MSCAETNDTETMSNYLQFKDSTGLHYDVAFDTRAHTEETPQVKPPAAAAEHRKLWFISAPNDYSADVTLSKDMNS